MDAARALALYAAVALCSRGSWEVASFSVDAVGEGEGDFEVGAAAVPVTLLSEAEVVARQESALAKCAGGARCTQMRNCRLLVQLLDRTCLNTNRLRDLTCGYLGSEPLMCCPEGYTESSPVSHAPPASITAFSPGCGRRIVAGADSGLGLQPWAVRVAFKNTRSNKFIYPCCGSIITPNTIMTAAHCALAINDYYKLSSVVAGEYDSRGDPDCTREYCALPVQNIAVSHVIVHPGYERKIFKHDVALLVLKSPLNYSLAVQPVCISDAVQNEVQRTASRARLVGWGRLPGQDASSPRQQQLDLPLLPLERCAQTYRRQRITGRQMCAGGEEGRDACSGFGGAPLMVQGYSNRHYQIGMASFGSDKCGENDVPSVYTNVGKYADWIKSNLVE